MNRLDNFNQTPQSIVLSQGTHEIFLSNMIKRPSFYGAKRAIMGEVVTEVNAKGGGLRLSKD